VSYQCLADSALLREVRRGRHSRGGKSRSGASASNTPARLPARRTNQASSAAMTAALTTIFRPALPPPAIELSTGAGIEIFQRALLHGTARSFFKQVEQLHTQQEPAYCGLASLVTILNALGVDPKRTWKGSWR
jgi:hypothetical protein